MLDALLANKSKINITIFYNTQKQKAILDFLFNKFKERFFLLRRMDFLRLVQSLFKNDGAIYPQGAIPSFITPKKNIVKINSSKDYKKLIKWRNEIKLDNKLINSYTITTIKQKIEYVIFKVPFNNDRDRQFRGKLHLLGYKVLELKIVSFGKISLGSLKEGDLKLSSKFVFKNIVL